MARTLADYRLFFKEFRRTFRTTGAILPSGRALAKALASNIGSTDAPQRILEVGPGTGAVTAAIVAAMGVHDRLDLVELNESFVTRLQDRFANEPAFARVADRSRVLHMNVERLTGAEPYDLVISGLPFTNFEPHEVEHILNVVVGLMKPGATLSFFEYIAMRKAKQAISGGEQRDRLRGIGQVLDQLFDAHDTRRQWIWPNLPPAWVHHIRTKPSAGE